MIDKIKKFYKIFDVDTNKIYGSYKIEKKVFRYSFLLILVLLGIAVLTAPSLKMVYVDCPLGSTTLSESYTLVNGCPNPFYEHCKQDIVPCNERFLNAGSTYGEPFTVPFFHKYFIEWVLIILFYAIMINHLKYNLKYNRGKKI